MLKKLLTTYFSLYLAFSPVVNATTQTTNLNNAGLLQAGDNITLQALNQITNQGGNIQANNTLTLLANNDINNIRNNGDRLLYINNGDRLLYNHKNTIHIQPKPNPVKIPPCSKNC